MIMFRYGLFLNLLCGINNVLINYASKSLALFTYVCDIPNLKEGGVTRV